MEKKSIKKIAAIIIIIASAGAFSHTLIRSYFYSPIYSEYAPPYATASIGTSTDSAYLAKGVRKANFIDKDRQSLLPIILNIPKLGIRANVQEVGLTAEGDIGIPSNFTDVAWYKYGPAPGEMGTAVLNGHVDNGLSLAGVFKRLDELMPGDQIYVDSKTGQKLRFVVTDSALYPFDELPSEIFRSASDSKLALITCKGSWLKNERTYDKRLVVIAELASN